MSYSYVSLLLAILTGLLAGAGSFMINRLVWKISKNGAMLIAGPAVEEALKTGLAYAVGAQVLISHLVFGMLEGFYDFKQSSLPLKGRYQTLASSILGHTTFGFLAEVSLQESQSLLFTVIICFMVHMMMNLVALWLTTKAR